MMHDMNFFSDMSLEQKRVRSRLAISIVSILAIAIILVALFIGATLFFNAQEKNLQERQDKLTEPAVSEQLAQIDDLQKQINNLQNSEKILQALNLYIEYNPGMGTRLLDSLTMAMPDDLLLDSISVSDDGISVSGRSLEERSPLIFSAALKESGEFSDVYLSGITRTVTTAETTVTTEPAATEPGETTAPQPTDPAVNDPGVGGESQYSFSLTCRIQPINAQEEGEVK